MIIIEAASVPADQEAVGQMDSQDADMLENLYSNPLAGKAIMGAVKSGGMKRSSSGQGSSIKLL